MSDFRTLYLQCQCNDLPHLARLLYDPNEEAQWRELFLEVLLPHENWRVRARSAWRLLIGRISPYDDVACVILNPARAAHLRAFVDDYLACLETEAAHGK